MHRMPLAVQVRSAAEERRPAAGCLVMDFVGKNFAEGAVVAPLPFVEPPASTEAGHRRLPVSL